MTQEKKPTPVWAKMVLAATASAGLVVGGQKLSVDSPVHFGVVGEAPKDAEGWKCAPEGGLIGAPMVCHFVSNTSTGFDVSTGTGVQ